MGSYSTINTFHQAPSPAQIVAYVLFVFQVILFYVIMQPNIDSRTASITLHILYAFATCGQFIFTGICSCTDPSDQIMVAYCTNHQQVASDNINQYLYCDICRSYVKTTSRHCRVCRRCVQGFDHHCIWINNCIGSLNYRSFVGMIICTMGSMSVYITSVAVVWAQGNYLQFLPQMIVLWAIGFIVAIFDILILNLNLLHLYLACKGITTYELIMQQRDKKKMEDMEARMVQQQKKGKIQKQRKPSQGEQNNHNSFADKKGNAEDEVIDNRDVNQVHEQFNRTEGNILDNKEAIMELDQMEQGNGIRRTRAERKRGFQQEVINDSESDSRASLNLSHFFARNRSLKILVSSDADRPMIPTSLTTFAKPAKFKQWQTVPIEGSVP